MAATPNPLTLGLCSDFIDYEFMVTNISDETVTGIVVQPPNCDFVLSDPFEIGDLECFNEIEELSPGESCVVTKAFVGDTTIPGFQTISVTGQFESEDSITPLTIEAEVTFDNCDDFF